MDPGSNDNRRTVLVIVELRRISIKQSKGIRVKR